MIFCNECSRLEGLEPVYVIEDVGEDKSFKEDLDKWLSSSNGSRVVLPTAGGEEHLYTEEQ